MSTPKGASAASVEVESLRFQKISVEILDEAHRDALVRAISRVLSTDIAEVTFAQLLDGVPTTEVALDTSSWEPTPGHPVYSHEEICPGMLEKAREFRAAFNPEILKFESRLLFAYQAASPGSRAFNMRLIELVAVAVHQIAVIVFKLDSGLHKDEGIAEWVPPKSEWVYWEFFPDRPPPLFCHPWYMDQEQYPDGVADVAGYWAEARILGGVLLFDRRRDAIADPDAVYIHPMRRAETYRICKLLPAQKQTFLNFLVTDEDLSQGGGEGSGAIPIRTGLENRDRVDPEEPIAETGIYRDIWERKERPPPEVNDSRMSDRWSKVDFPTPEDKFAAHGRARARMEEHQRRELESREMDESL